MDNPMNFENLIFQDYKNFLTTNSIFSPNVVPSSNKTLSKFPTVLFKEQNNASDTTTTDNSQKTYDITDVIEIYTQKQVVGTTTYASKYVMDELKYLTFEFFEYYGARRISCEPTEYYNKEVDRLVITYSYNVNNWNRKIN